MNMRRSSPGPNLLFRRMKSRAVLDLFRSQGELFEPDVSAAASVDPGDTKFLQCAVAALADYVVTGNKGHFPESSYGYHADCECRRIARPDHA